MNVKHHTGLALVFLAATAVRADKPPATAPADTYETVAKGIRILPGHWRPHYPWEQIAWISPAWPSQDYLWFDFPEAIFTKQGMLFLSAANPQVVPPMFPDLPAVAWSRREDGIEYDRRLPNGFRWHGRIVRAEPLRASDRQGRVDFELGFVNGSTQTFTDFRLQTCLFLRASREFAAHTPENKRVHTASRGWLPFEEAKRLPDASGTYHLGWRGGPTIADLPVMITTSVDGRHHVAMTWLDSTYALTQNPQHPCMHADPTLPDMAPGVTAKIRGHLWFFEGTLGECGEFLRSELRSKR